MVKVWKQNISFSRWRRAKGRGGDVWLHRFTLSADKMILQACTRAHTHTQSEPFLGHEGFI